MQKSWLRLIVEQFSQLFRQRHPRLRPVALLLLSMPLWTGCDGCRRSSSETASKLDDKKLAPIDEYTFGGAVPLPAGGSATVTAIKPGHWFSLRQSIRSNQADQRGDLSFNTFISDPSLGSSLRVENGTGIICQRPAVLPKGRMKRLDVRLLASTENIAAGKRISTAGKFSSESSCAIAPRIDHQVMRSNEYFFVILTTRPERFSSFQIADWVRPPATDPNNVVPNNYRIVFPRSSGLLSLPETMFDWTSTAVLFWDDVSPSELTAEQRRAMTDWLHFGGRLIVNGDAIASELAKSELGSFLPLAVRGMEALDSDALADLIKQWSVAGDDSQTSITTLVREQASRISIGGDLVQDAAPVAGTAELLSTKRSGLGEVVMSRFDLTADWLDGWKSRDSFFNAAMLARPRRSYDISSGSLIQKNVDESLNDAAINTSVRFASRDARLAFAKTTADQVEVVQDTFAAHPISGLGGWSDDSDIARMLQSELREQSGVTIPPSPFVLRALAIYLTVLVPVNYIVFRLLGRLEWAWLAIPFLALIGAGWIARSVSLDLGLARNRSEVSFLEIQPGYARGHLTRFASIYNSLSGNYQVQFDVADAAITSIEALGKATGVEPCILKIGYASGPMLDNFSVPSNRTRLFHAEQVVELGGTIELVGDTLRNNTTMRLADVIVMRKSSENQVDTAVVEAVDPSSQIRLRWSENRRSTGGISLLQPFLNSDSIPTDCIRLIASATQSLPGMTIVPETPQQSVTTIVLVHLKHPVQQRSTGDTNLMPSQKQREKLLLDNGFDPGSVKEIIVR